MVQPRPSNLYVCIHHHRTRISRHQFACILAYGTLAVIAKSFVGLLRRYESGLETETREEEKERVKQYKKASS